MLQLTLVKNNRSLEEEPLTSEIVVCERLGHARHFFTRMIGLLTVSSLKPESGLWITPSNGVHTFGMRFAIDVVALDESNTVLKVWQNVAPQRLVFMPRRTRSVLELAAGTVKRHAIASGDLCKMREAEAA